MIRTITLAVFLCIVSLVPTKADETITVKLDNDTHKQQIIELSCCNIFLDMKDDVNGIIRIHLDLENRQENKEILLFNNGYGEKSLKKMRPAAIVYDKYFGGTKKKRIIEPCRGLGSDFRIAPSDRENIMMLTGYETVMTCRLPIYIAEYKPRSFFRRQRYTLMEKLVVELNIEVTLKPDSTYWQLHDEYTALIGKLEHTVFCTNKRHTPSLEEQKAAYRQKIETCLARIDRELTRHHWPRTDARYKLYMELQDKLKQIDLTAREGDCGKHKATHRCRYCNLSLRQIYHRLDDHYQTIYSSTDRQTTKEKLIREVRALYFCAIDRHRQAEWRANDYKAKIIDRYNRINRF